MLDQYGDILTISELAEFLKIGTTQAYRLVRSHKIKAFKEGKDWKHHCFEVFQSLISTS